MKKKDNIVCSRKTLSLSEKLGHKSENKISRKLPFLKIPRNVNFKIRTEVSFGYFWVPCSGIDRETYEEVQCHEMDFFLKNKISRKLRKTKTFIFENYQECQIQNAVERWVFGIFEYGFSGIDTKTCQEALCAIKWNFSLDLRLDFSDRVIKFFITFLKFLWNFIRIVDKFPSDFS